MLVLIAHLGHPTTRIELHQLFIKTTGVKSAHRQKWKDILETVYKSMRLFDGNTFCRYYQKGKNAI